MKRKVNLASAIGILLAAAGFAIDAIQGAIEEKERKQLIHDEVEEEVKRYLTKGEDKTEDEEEAE